MTAEWISVEDRLPDSNGYWLCWSWKKLIKPDNGGAFTLGFGHVKICWFAPNQQRWETIETVTHWMPLPEPPQ